MPDICPSCSAPDSLIACGPGVERLAEEVSLLFPGGRYAIMTSDLITSSSAATDLIDRMLSRQIDILIGTQMVAKGHHFPNLTLVGVVDADIGLHGGDFRASERSFQLLHQVGGRAGRGVQPGHVILQTADPAHPVMTMLVEGDLPKFLAHEREMRRTHHLPPFGRMAALILSAPDSAMADEIAQRLARLAPHGEGFTILGPAPAPLAFLRNRHRRRFLIKARREIVLQPLLREWLARMHIPPMARLAVDIDPYSFL